MSLGLIKRVALWNEQRRRRRLSQVIELLKQRDASDPLLPMAIANLWRDTGVSVFTEMPLDEQLSFRLTRTSRSLEQVGLTLEKLFQLICADDYTHFNLYLSRQLSTRYTNSLSEFLTDTKGLAIDVGATHTYIASQLYVLASTLDAHETYEYHRGLNTLYRDLMEILNQLLTYKPN